MAEEFIPINFQSGTPSVTTETSVEAPSTEAGTDVQTPTQPEVNTHTEAGVDTGSPIRKVEPNEVQTPDFAQYDKLVQEVTGGEISTFAEFQEAVKAMKSEPEYVSPLAKAIDEYQRNGGENVQQFIALQNLDLDKMSPRDILINKAMLDHGMGREKAKLYIESQYPEPASTDDLYDNDLAAVTKQNQVSELKLEMASEEAKKALAKQKVEASAYENPELKAVRDNAKAEAERAKNFQSAVAEVAKSFKNVTFKLGEDNVEYRVEPGSKDWESAVKTTSNPHTFFQRYVTQEGKEDIPSLMRDMYILDNFSAIANAIFNQGKSSATGEILDKVENPGIRNPGGKAAQVTLDEVNNFITSTLNP